MNPGVCGAIWIDSQPARGKLGSIEVGKLAGFIVVDRNIFEIPIDVLNETQVDLTAVAGKVVYGRNWRQLSGCLARSGHRRNVGCLRFRVSGGIDAAALRVHLSNVFLPDSADVYFFSFDGQAHGPYRGYDSFWVPRACSLRYFESSCWVSFFF